MSKKKTPPKWIDVYPQGTKDGDEEQKFFIALARNAKWEWRTVVAIAKDAGLSPQRVEEIIQKYHKKYPGMIVQSPKNEDLWAYWERVPDMSTKDTSSVTDKDQEERISKVTKKNP